ncbi:MAG: 3-oxoacyl-ACP reductase [Micrococcales bacterium 73-15]|uniref:3-oxoacyl-ACP reductase n=1 Tax=Salana multivorans TaxID=120377 RepID=UPI000968B69B|nr:3-oxoacyl-ACP reductase [Salana multivorans]OJX96061.1 MAG: 3-oxoacyl-ACP reductase [Micrococcales bacterium 73-15]
MVTIPAPLRGVQRQIASTLTKALGLTEPVQLRRTDPDSVDVPLVAGPVLVVGDAAPGEGGGDGSGEVAGVVSTLRSWGCDVREWSPETGAPSEQRWGAVVVVLTGLTAPDQAAAPVLALGSVLRDLARCARVVVISRLPSDATRARVDGTDDASRRDDRSGDGEVSPAEAAARAGVEGLVRSLGKELRAGATANGIQLADGIDVLAPAAVGTLRFLLSARSAFVNGQLVPVTGDGEAPADWARPLAGKVAVVTGAARGIGAETVRVLVRDGALVLGVDVPAAGEALARTMNAAGGVALQLDITAPDAAERILEAIGRGPFRGRLDVLVHNAGILRDKLLANMTPAQWESVVAVNLAAQLAITAGLAEAAPGLVQVSLASTSGIAGNRGQTNYGFSKAGVIGATQAWAVLLGEGGGRANAVAPGFIETEMTASIPAVQREISRRVSSLGQGGKPVDVGEAVAFLASPQAGGINGQVLRVCGQNLVGR